MKKVFKKGISLFLALLMLTSGIGAFASDTVAPNSSPRIFIIGDSTACSYGSDSERTGWGEALQNFLTDPKMIVNAASPGESSHSFYDKEWHWNTVKARLKAGDYLLIQFGHNDCPEGENTDYSYYSDAELPIDNHNPESGQYSYKWYLKKYIDTAIDAGAYPILVTSVERKTHLTSSASPLKAYADAMKALATEEVPVIDVWTEFRANAETAAESWYVSDGVHLNEEGARSTARIFANKIKAAATDNAFANSLASHLVDNVDEVTTHTDILGINENFEDYTLPVEGNLFPGKPLDSTIDNKTDSTYGYVMKENEENNMLKIVASSSAYTVNWSLPYQLTSGYYRLKYRFKSDKSSTMEFVTTIGTYGATTRYSKNSINYSKADNLTACGVELNEGKWAEAEYYFAPGSSKGEMYIHCNGIKISTATVSSTVTNASKLANVKQISIGFATSKSGTLYLDDIEFSEISEKDYNEAKGAIPEEITAMEDFEHAYPGVTIDTTHYGWSAVNSVDNSFIEYAQDPDDNENIVAKLHRSVQTISKNHSLAYNLNTALLDGVYSAKFRIYANDENSNAFWISILDSAGTGSTGRHNIYFKVSDGTVGMYTTINDSDNTLNRSYPFETENWYDIEVVYDLTSKSDIYATVYVNNTKVINNVLVGGKTKQVNDGTISSIQLMLPSDGSATTLSPENATEGETYASFLLDDIVIKQTSIVTDVNVNDDGKLTGISAYFDAAPSTSPKFVAAVYDGTTLKDVAFANAEAKVETQSATLSKQLSVASGNTVKVYYWDMTKLLPCIKMFETVIQ